MYSEVAMVGGWIDMVVADWTFPGMIVRCKLCCQELVLRLGIDEVTC